MEPVRLLEAHMASLRQSYEDWMDNEPEDLESDRPTDAEMAAFEAAEMNHIEQVRSYIEFVSWRCFRNTLTYF